MTTPPPEWTCERGCSQPHWAHQLYGSVGDAADGFACPPTGDEITSQPRDCCGRPANNMRDDEERVCSKGQCVAFWCLCGQWTGASAGPVGCDCEYDRGEVTTVYDDAADVADDDLD